MKLSTVLFSLLVSSLAPLPAAASSSETVEVEGGSVRLVTSGLAASDGTLRGALVVTLKPGWKTYWRDPGASGVPPSIDVSQSHNIEAAEFRFPAPQWHSDDYGDWAGYDASVSLPVEFRVPRPDRFSLVEASIFLGICETICIPLDAKLTVEPGADPDSFRDRALVAAAFAALPAGAAPDLGVRAVSADGDWLRIETVAPQGIAPELFLAGEDGIGFARPRAEGGAGKIHVFRARMHSPKSLDVAGRAVSYTLVSGDRAVSGRFSLP